MATPRVTRADVAKRANVSATIVSYVINNNRYVDSDKRRRVLQAIEELRYHPNNFARALKGKRSNHFLLIADQVANEYFGTIVNAMNRRAQEMGYIISLLTNQNGDECVQEIINRQFDGIVVGSASFPTSGILRLLEAGLPVILLMNRDYRNLPDSVGKIHTGLYEGMRECVKALVREGRRRLVYLGGRSSGDGVSEEMDLRYQGFKAGIEESGLDFRRENVIAGWDGEERMHAVIREKLLGGFPPDAMVGGNDQLACIGLSAAREIQRRIPEDVAVAGFGDSSLSKYMHPRLTTMRMPIADIGEAAVEMLESMLNGGTPKTLRFSTRLIRREST